jgi:peptidoglycan hydrolase-like protein with peptidoglycan-binding domain
MSNVRIGHASIDEDGEIAGGSIGDQTGKEICIRLWYDKDWDYYLECIDPIIADKAATFVEQVCTDPNYGYDQSQRLTGYNNILANHNEVKGGKGEFDCSSLDAAAYIFAGLKLSPACTTRDLRKALMATGKFREYSDAEHLTSSKYAKRGGIYLKEGHHVVMALEDGNPYPVPERTIYYDDEHKTVVCSGDDVRFIQFELRKVGIKYVIVDGVRKELKIDGKCGPVTHAGIIAYQIRNKLVVDGRCGSKTVGHMMN